MIEHHSGYQIPFSQKVSKSINTLAYAFPFLTGHRPRDVEVEQNCEVLKFELEDWNTLLLEEKGCSLVVPDAYYFLSLLET